MGKWKIVTDNQVAPRDATVINYSKTRPLQPWQNPDTVISDENKKFLKSILQFGFDSSNMGVNPKSFVNLKEMEKIVGENQFLDQFKKVVDPLAKVEQQAQFDAQTAKDLGRAKQQMFNDQFDLSPVPKSGGASINTMSNLWGETVAPTEGIAGMRAPKGMEKINPGIEYTKRPNNYIPNQFDNLFKTPRIDDGRKYASYLNMNSRTTTDIGIANSEDYYNKLFNVADMKALSQKSSSPIINTIGNLIQGERFHPQKNKLGGQIMGNGGQVKPIIVNDKNDPRLRAYQDSLTLFNQAPFIENKLKQGVSEGYANGLYSNWNKHYVPIINRLTDLNNKHPEYTVSKWYGTTDVPDHKFNVWNFNKPTQPVEYQPKQESQFVPQPIRRTITPIKKKEQTTILRDTPTLTVTKATTNYGEDTSPIESILGPYGLITKDQYDAASWNKATNQGKWKIVNKPKQFGAESKE